MHVCVHSPLSNLESHGQQRQKEPEGSPMKEEVRKKIINHCCCPPPHSLLPMSPFFSHDYIHNTVVYFLSLQASGSFLLSL